MESKNLTTIVPTKPIFTKGIHYLSAFKAAVIRPLLTTPEGRNTFTLSLVLILYCLSFTGSLNQLLAYLFHEDIHSFNTTYLETASDNAITTLEVVASIKAALALLQSLSGGVSFIVDIDVQLGESLSVIRDITDNAWSISIGSVGAANALSMLHNSIYSVMQPLLIALFLLLGFYLSLKNPLPALANRLKRLIKPCLFLVIFTHLIVPFSIYTTGKISNDYLQTQKQDLHDQLSEFNDGLPQHSASSGLKEQVSELGEHFKGNLLSHISSTGNYSLLTIKHILYTSAEFVFLPLIFMVVSSIMMLILLRKRSSASTGAPLPN